MIVWTLWCLRWSGRQFGQGHIAARHGDIPLLLLTLLLLHHLHLPHLLLPLLLQLHDLPLDLLVLLRILSHWARQGFEAHLHKNIIYLTLVVGEENGNKTPLQLL